MSVSGTFKSGDTFRPSNRNVDIHLWIILSDPLLDPDHVLIVSMTTYKSYKDSACLLQIGEHRAVTCETCIAYEHAKITTIDRLRQAGDQELLRPDVPVTQDILKRIRDGSAVSRKMAIEHFELLVKQGLV